MKIREVTATDIDAIVRIYNPYIENTTISFEEEPVTNEIMQQRVEQLSSIGLPWLVAEQDGEVLGYAYASQWKPRSAYRFTVEPTIYLAPQAKGKGVGRVLFTELFNRLKAQGIKNAISVIALPNPSSIGIHEAMGFKKVGEFANIGVKFGKQVSVGYWQLELS